MIEKEKKETMRQNRNKVREECKVKKNSEGKNEHGGWKEQRKTYKTK